MIKRRLSWFYKDLTFVFSISLAVVILCLSLCLSIDAKADSYVDGTYYYNNSIFYSNDTLSNFQTNYSENSYWNDGVNTKWVNINSSDDYVYLVVWLDQEVLNNLTFECVLYDARDWYMTTYDDIFYVFSFTYCSYADLNVSSLPYSNNYYIFDDTTYLNSLDFTKYYGGGFELGDYSVKGFVINLLDTNYNYSSLILKFNRNYVSYVFGSNNLNPIGSFASSILNSYYQTTNNSQSSYSIGYNLGYEDGFSAGRIQYSSSGYINGYSDGYNDGLLESSADYGIHDLFFSILDIPLEILSNLFSFTIFGTVAWSLIASFIVLGLVIWLIRKFFH